MEIHKDDALPQQICTSCVNKLDFVCNFYDSCHVIQERLLWLIESSKNRRQEIQPADYQTNKGDDPTQEGVTLGTEYSIEYSTIIIKEECLPDLNLKLYSLNQETQPASCQTNKEDDPTQEEVTLDTKYSTEYSNSINKKECLPDLNLDVYPSNRETQPANCQTNKEDDPMQEGVTLATEYSTEHSNLIIKEECLPDLNLVVYPSSQETKKQSASYQMNKGDNPMQSHLESKFKCPKYLNVYKSKQSLNEHLLKHESIKKSHLESKFTCPKCPNVYKSKQSLNEHLLKHESIKKSHLESKFKCPKCPKVYKSKQYLNDHLLKHEDIKKSDSESKFKCLKCPNVYKRKQNLNEHMLKHEDIKKNFSCDTCGKIYHSHRNMRVHMRRHRSNSFVCEICRDHLSSKEALEKHHKTSHLESKFKCPKCPNMYKSKQSLNEHLLKHKGIQIRQDYERDVENDSSNCNVLKFFSWRKSQSLTQESSATVAKPLPESSQYQCRRLNRQDDIAALSMLVTCLSCNL
ncbi:hypothetical protein DBV15_00449 [Temnothorax longispinosus]|uniref:C2H2-type domain-containing protein n=1 Tax=Temnothorax longispinosus TaxID=300112 RepID=A0A4S2JUM1_9HYME|nr:hypothetical protein DBV15_00449 [Temnothorax longispinosus]